MTKDDALLNVIKCLGGQWQNRKKALFLLRLFC